MAKFSEEEYKLIQEKEWQWARDLIQKQIDDKRPGVQHLTNRPIINLKQMMDSSLELYADSISFYTKFKKGPYSEIKFQQVYDDMNAMGTALINLGLKDKRIAVLGENSYMWCIGYLGTVCGTGIVVPLDKELTAKELKNLVKTADVSAVIFDEKREQTFIDMKNEGDTDIEYLICQNRHEDTPEVLSFWKLLEKGYELIKDGNRDFLDAQIDSEEMGILIFTSGTTGVAKGVMLSHKNIAADLMVSPTLVDFLPTDIFFSVLPLHHTYECTCNFIMPLYKGGAIAHCEGLKYIVKNIQEVHPTFFLGVPAIFEMLYKKIWQGIRKKGKENTVKRIIKISNGLRKVGIDLTGTFFKEIKETLGGSMRMMICGGSAINPEVVKGINDFGIVCLQGYGLSECAPMGALVPENGLKHGSCGIAFPGFDAKIINKDDDGIGEICLMGDNVMLGYYNMPEETAKVKDSEGWFHTGDLGYIDEDGYIYITGRQKNVIITKNGKNVFPEELEYYMSNVDLIAESMVWGAETADGADIQVVAGIYPDWDVVKEVLGEEAEDDANVEKLIWHEIDKINEDIAFYKRIKKIHIRHEEFEKNTSRKIKRFVESNKKL